MRTLRIDDRQRFALLTALRRRIDSREDAAAICFTCAYVHAKPHRPPAEIMAHCADYLDDMHACVEVMLRLLQQPRRRRRR